MNKKIIAKNIIVGFGGQLITIILGLVIPRIFIKSYGSDVNGLLSTITQIFTYMALLEAGIGQAARNALLSHLPRMIKKVLILLFQWQKIITKSLRLFMLQAFFF